MTLRWGIISTARINRKWIPGIRDAEENELIAVASRDHARSEEFAKKWSIARNYGTYESLLEDPDVDAVYIPLPNHLHKEWIIKACLSGKHVLCEKPLVLSANDIIEIQAAAQENNCLVSEAFMYKHHPQTFRIEEILQSGEIGEIIRFYGNFSFLLDRPDDIRWKAEMGGGCLWDVGCYPVSLAILIFGEPVTVSGIARISETGVDSTFGGLLEFKAGKYAQINASFELPHDTHCMIFGTKGSLTITNAFVPDTSMPMILKNQKGSREIFTVFDKDLYAYEIENFQKAVQGIEELRVPLSESKINTRVLTGLLESSTRGLPVAIID